MNKLGMKNNEIGKFKTVERMMNLNADRKRNVV
jgi:hypothetical protein